MPGGMATCSSTVTRTMPEPADLSDEELGEHLVVLAREFRVSPPVRRSVIMRVINAVLDEMNGRTGSP